MNKAIVVLTRGYESFVSYQPVSGYGKLIKRNISISKNLKNKQDYDILICHEGNISSKHQQRIKEYTLELNIKFINVKQKPFAFRKEKESIEHYPPTDGFCTGYRHMCSFWFVDFWPYVEEYDYIVRIDEDCEIYSPIEQIFNRLKNNYLVYAAMGAGGNNEEEEEGFAEGLNNFTIDFLKKKTGTKAVKKNTIGPYTNVMGFNLKTLRIHELLKLYIKEVDLSNNIYTYRWGDLPLWGEVVDYIFNKDFCFLDKQIKYFHGSHEVRVN